MRFLKHLLTAVATVLIGTAVTASNAVAQDSGCPWCTTPTKCEVIPQSTPIAGCYIMGNGDCRWWEGSCSVSFASGDPAALLQRKGLAYGGTVVVNLWGAEVVLAAIGDGLFAEWGCSGDLLGLYRRQADGGWEEVDATAKRVALSLNRDLGSRHSSGAQL